MVIMSDKIYEIANYIRSQGWRNEILVYPLFQYPYYNDSNDKFYGVRWCEQNKHILDSLYLKTDAYTQRCLQEMLHQRSMSEFDFVPLNAMIDFSHNNLYFYDDAIAPHGDITVVNCGAYDGDSIEILLSKYGERVKKIYAYEPDLVNCDAMKLRLNRLGALGYTDILPFGVYDKNGELRFSSTADMGSHFDDGGDIVVPVCTIDNTVTQVTGSLCINMDVEGCEVAAINGAKETIKKYHPYLAICLYHQWNDFFEVPMAIKAIRDDYDFYIRSGSHPECYAVPRK